MQYLLARWTTLFAVLCSTGLAWCQETERRFQEPSQDEVSRLREELKDLYPSYYRSAQTDTGHRRLATEFLKQAVVEETDADLRFVMLTEAYEHAATGGESELAIDAIRELRRTHDVRVASLHSHVLDILNGRQDSRSISPGLVNETAKILDRAVWDGDFEGAKELTTVAKNVFATLQDDALLTLITDREAGLPAARALTDAAHDYESGTGTDSDARLAAGKHLCFFVGNWTDGLPLLVTGSDIELHDLAQRDIKGADDPIERAAIADGWWDRMAQELPFCRGRLKARAAYWYAPALTKLTGATARQASERFGEVQANFVFNGAGYIETPLTESVPIVLEAWVHPDPFQDKRRWKGNDLRALAMIISSDIGGKYGLGIGLIDNKLHVEQIPAFHETTARVVSTRPSHLRVAFNRDQTFVFLNGRHVAEFPATQSRSTQPFTIGRTSPNGQQPYRGRIRQIRIIRNQVGKTNFRPPESLAPSPKAVLVYDALAIEGDNVIDLSGHGNNGLMHGVRVELDYTP